MKKVLFKDKFNLIMMALFSTLAIIFEISIAKILRDITNNVVENNWNEFFNLCFYIVLIAFLGVAFQYLGKVYQSKYKKNVFIFIKQETFKRLIYSERNIYSKESAMDYISSFTNDISLIEQDYFDNFINLILNIIRILIACVLLSKINWIITVLIIFSSLIMALAPILLSKPMKNKTLKLSNSNLKFTQFLTNNLFGFKIIKSFMLENAILKNFNLVNIELENTKKEKNIFSAMIDSILSFVYIVCQFSGMILTAFLVLKGSANIGNIFEVMQLSNSVFSPVRQGFLQITKIKGSKPVFQKLNSILNLKQTEFNSFSSLFKEIYLKDFCIFHNIKNEEKNYLLDKKINYKFEKNKKYLLTGDSGSGKSTLVDCICGLGNNFEGNIYLNEYDVSYKNTILRELVAYIPQSSFLFQDSIKNNIVLDKEFNEELYKKALNLSGLDNFLSSFLEGEDTILYENGNNLSGGQRQSISIARAIYKNTPVIVVDEGTSALDYERKKIIENNILTMDKTIIFISHQIDENLISYFNSWLNIKDRNIEVKLL